MNVAQILRKPVEITFSPDFEALLLAQDTLHNSLSEDLEYAARAGIERLAYLEDVHDLSDTEHLTKLIEQARIYLQMQSPHFTHWVIHIAEDLLDEIELIRLTHGEDLLQLGIRDTKSATLLVYLAVAGTADLQ